MGRVWAARCAVCVLAGCAKIVGIDDYTLHDSAAAVDVPNNDASIDAPLGSFGAYLKASNTGANNALGSTIALSTDGGTLVVGAPFENSAAVGIDGDQTSNAASNAGAVYVFVRTGTAWMQQAYIKASNTNQGDRFGSAIAISADGNTLAVGAPREDSNSVGIDGLQTNNSADNAGAVYVFTRAGATWTQQAYVKASNTGSNDQFGSAVALSGDGDTLAVGAPDEDSTATGVNGDQGNGNAQAGEVAYGAVYVFVRAGALWVQQAYVKASNSGANDTFGSALALSADGNTLVVTAPQEDSNAVGVNGNQSSNNATSSGAAYVFRRVQGIWAQQAYLKASNTESNDDFGRSIAVSGDSSTIAVGAPLEDGNATGIDGANNNGATNAGATYVFAQVATVWTAQAYVKASNTEQNDQFGFAVALSHGGDTMLVGAHLEDSAATGLGGNQMDNSIANAGAAYAFTRSGTTWAQSHYLKATNSGSQDRFGQALAVAGSLFAIGAPEEDSSAIGVDGDQTNNTATNSGAVYVVQ